MIVPDFNFFPLRLQPAHAPPRASTAARWEAEMKGEELNGLSNEVTLGFVRMASHLRLGAVIVLVSHARQMMKK